MIHLDRERQGPEKPALRGLPLVDRDHALDLVADEAGRRRRTGFGACAAAMVATA
jgi:hypothetical protein